MYHDKTDPMEISEHFKKSPFAQGYSDSYMLNFYDNPFTGEDDEVEWWKQYCLGFAYGQRRRAAREESWSSLFQAE